MVSPEGLRKGVAPGVWLFDMEGLQFLFVQGKCIFSLLMRGVMCNVRH